jgi:CheY-like chemotaxis protein
MPAFGFPFACRVGLSDVSDRVRRTGDWQIVCSEAVTKPSPILLVEDDENDIFFIQRAFKVAGLENPLVVARNGEEAIVMLTDKARPLHPCLLITDLKMPRVDGLELLLWLRTRPEYEGLPKLVITSSILQADLTKSLLLGAKAYFTKPHGLDTLAGMVGEWKKAYVDKRACTAEQVRGSR